MYISFRYLFICCRHYNKRSTTCRTIIITRVYDRRRTAIRLTYIIPLICMPVGNGLHMRGTRIKIRIVFYAIRTEICSATDWYSAIIIIYISGWPGESVLLKTVFGKFDTIKYASDITSVPGIQNRHVSSGLRAMKTHVNKTDWATAITANRA